MTPEDVLRQFRAEFGDSVAPYFWSDEELLVYLNEAHRVFVRGMGGLRDVITVPFVANERFAELPSTLIKIKKAYLEADNRPVEILNIEELETTGGAYKPTYVDDTPKQGITGLKEGNIRWMPIPTTSGNVEMAVLRQTTLVITESNLNTGVFDVPEEYHRKLVYGIAGQALLKHDAETFEERSAADLQELFFAEIAAARDDRERQLHNPRTVQYGGIDVGGAYDWSRSERW